jgi:hypothetical protein
MSQQLSLSLLDVLDKLLDDHIKSEEAYYGEVRRRTDAYKKYLERRKKELAKRRSQLRVEVEDIQGKKELREPSDSDLGGMAYNEAKKWIEQNPRDRNLDFPRENTPFQHAVQVLIGDHHLTIVDDSGDFDIDGGNLAEEQVRKWLVNRRSAKRSLGELTGATPLEAELKRLDTPVVVQSVLRESWNKYPCECEGMGLPAASVMAGGTAKEADQGGGKPVNNGDDPDAPLAPARLADRLGIPQTDTKAREALRKRLEKWRNANRNGGWIEIADPKPKQPRYLYLLGKVWSVIEDMKRSG